MAMRWVKLYADSTPAEIAMEEAVARLGVPYRTQWPGWLFGLRYYPDIVLPTLGVVIEVDDPSHEKKAEEDAERSRRIEDEWGWKVLRVTNEKALEDASGALQGLLRSAGLWPIPSRLPPLKSSLPKRKKAAAKERREAKAETRQKRRRAPRRGGYRVRPPKDTLA